MVIMSLDQYSDWIKRSKSSKIYQSNYNHQWNPEAEGHLDSKPCRIYGHHWRPHQGIQQVST